LSRRGLRTRLGDVADALRYTQHTTLTFESLFAAMLMP